MAGISGQAAGYRNAFEAHFEEAFPVEDAGYSLGRFDKAGKRDKVFLELYSQTRATADYLSDLFKEYGTKLQLEYKARQEHIRAKADKKSAQKVPLLARKVKEKFGERRFIGASVRDAVKELSGNLETFRKVGRWCSENKVALPENFEPLCNECCNILKADAVRRNSLGNGKSGPKMLLSCNAARIGADCSRRLGSNLTYLMNNYDYCFSKACKEFCEKQTQPVRQQRFDKIAETAKKALSGSVNLSSPNDFYRLSFVEFLKDFIKKPKRFDDRNIVRFMMVNGFQDESVCSALKECSLYFADKSDATIRRFVDGCRISFEKYKEELRKDQEKQEQQQMSAGLGMPARDRQGRQALGSVFNEDSVRGSMSSSFGSVSYSERGGRSEENLR